MHFQLLISSLPKQTWGIRLNKNAYSAIDLSARRNAQMGIKMKLIAVTQRVEKIQSYGEQRDALDENWTQFLVDCGCVPLLVPNHFQAAKLLLEHVRIDGIILTGGNNLVKYDGDAPQRDETERYLINYAIEKDIPLVGICRGMQVIQDYFGVTLNKVEGHVAVKHEVLFDGKRKEKNSYHSYASWCSTDELPVIARAEDDVVEAVRHREYKIYAMMWHPERNNPFEKEDIEFFKKIFNK